MLHKMELLKLRDSEQVKLLSNVQFLYELHLASLELSSFCSQWEFLSDFRSFAVKDPEIDNILTRSAYISGANGVSSDYAKLTNYNITRSFNQYITHWFYPYKGKYHPQMVRSLANIIGLKSGDTLLDPFIGSGTTALEGALLNLRVVGFDISPLCVLISKVKTNAVHHLPEISQYYPNDLEKGSRIKMGDMVECMSDPVKSFGLLAKMIATSDNARRNRDFTEMLIHNENKMIKSIQLMKNACAEIQISPTLADIRIGDARCLPLPDNSVEGIITSPPYSLALDYVANDSHSLEALGYDLSTIRENFIGVRGKGKERIEFYERDMLRAYSEMGRVLKPSGKAVIVIGDATVNGNKVHTTEKCIETFAKLGFKLIHTVDKLIYGLYNVMQREFILIFERY